MHDLLRLHIFSDYEKWMWKSNSIYLSFFAHQMLFNFFHHFLFEPSSNTLSLRTKFRRIYVCLTLYVRKIIWFYTSLHAANDLFSSVYSPLAFRSSIWLSVNTSISGWSLWSKVPAYIIRCQFSKTKSPVCPPFVTDVLQNPTQAAKLKSIWCAKNDK
jgi:hypothetical protein